MLIDGDAYLLQVIAYVLNNPIASGQVADPHQAEFSAGVQLVQRNPPKWLLKKELDDLIIGRDSFKSRVTKFLKQDDGLPSVLNQLAYGDPDKGISEQIQKARPAEATVVTPISHYISKGTDLRRTYALAVVEGNNRPADVARYFDVYPSTITRAVSMYRAIKQTSCLRNTTSSRLV